MDRSKESKILYHYEDKNIDVINEEGTHCAGVRQPSRESRPLERLDPQWDNNQ